MVKKTQIEMISDRGYDVSKESWLLEDKKNFKLNRRYKKQDDSIYVLYIHKNDELIAAMKNFKTKMLNTTAGIIIANAIQLKKLKKSIYEEYIDPLKQIQFFDYEELTYNLTKHLLSPTYIPIDKSLIIPSIAHTSQLPVILLDDPASKYYGWQAGQLIKIVDNNFNTDILMDYYISYCIVSAKILK